MTPFARRGACPALSAPMRTGDGLLVRLNPVTGEISAKQLIGLCLSASAHGNGIVEVTARGSLQIRGLTEESATALAEDVNTLGISARTGVPVETGPLAGLDPTEVADARPLAERIRKRVDEAGLAARLGPKVSVIVDGGGAFDLDEIIADVRLVAERENAWRLTIGGDAKTARECGVFDEAGAAEAALKVLEEVAARGRDARAKDLAVGIEMLLRPARPSVLPDISPSRGEIKPSRRLSLIANGAEKAGSVELPISPHAGEMSGRTEGGDVERPVPLGIRSLTSGTTALSIALPYGSMDAADMAAFGETAHALGATGIRPAPPRSLIVLGLDAAGCEKLKAVAADIGFITNPADPRLRIAACPGAPACASGHFDTRAVAREAASLAADMLNGSMTLHISGCAKGCAHPTPAALTLVGDENGVGFVVAGTAKGLPAHYTARYEAAETLARLAATLRAQRRAGETAAACLARLGPAVLTPDQTTTQERA
ncbi:precorrin-3B synthase [Oryzicola mucosus]|uniref:Precorrin-3B synthase n=1 Tax=Oryzicola mucosus TaxID=2767425 RepID=A0A8J6PUL6_9HYPH|nr:precorrin-3B synthase [Oryzicola mucosus]MBD0414811.1 precorrin-3B synthase [Oryzicola mucosus]